MTERETLAPQAEHTIPQAMDVDAHSNTFNFDLPTVPFLYLSAWVGVVNIQCSSLLPRRGPLFPHSFLIPLTPSLPQLLQPVVEVGNFLMFLLVLLT